MKDVIADLRNMRKVVLFFLKLSLFFAFGLCVIYYLYSERVEYLVYETFNLMRISMWGIESKMEYNTFYKITNWIFIVGSTFFPFVITLLMLDNIDCKIKKFKMKKYAIKVEKMANSLDINDLKYSPSCGSCGSEYATQEDINTLVYSRTTASADVYYCTDCKEESIQIFYSGIENKSVLQ